MKILDHNLALEEMRFQLQRERRLRKLAGVRRLDHHTIRPIKHTLCARPDLDLGRMPKELDQW